jgi:hypothetical protein
MPATNVVLEMVVLPWFPSRDHPRYSLEYRAPKTKKDPPLSTRTLRQALNQFVQMYRCTEYISRFPPVLLFCFKYKVPWIVKWSYQIKNNILIRNFAVKCWDNFDRDRIIKFVFDEFPEIKQVEDQPSSSIPDFLQENPLKSLQKYASWLPKPAKQPLPLPVAKENPQPSILRRINH